jgi:hypothetical protein
MSAEPDRSTRKLGEQHHFDDAGSAASGAAQRPGAVDGNVLAGPLREVFAVDLTTAVHRCSGCGRREEVATLRVYLDAPGLVARCPGCDAVTLRFVRGPDRAWLDVRGTVEIALAPSAE